MDFKCDLNCPASITTAFCCKNCRNSKKKYVNDTNKHLWSSETGFWTPSGCGLSREQMPKECREYDCRDYVVVVERRWVDGKWKDLMTNSILKCHKLAGFIVKRGD